MSYARATASSSLRVAAIPSTTPVLGSSKKTLSPSSSTPVSIAKPVVKRTAPSSSTTTTTSRPARIVSDSQTKSQTSSASVVANNRPALSSTTTSSSTFESRQAQRAREAEKRAKEREERRVKEEKERAERVANLEARKTALKLAKANREASLLARIKRDQDRKDRELKEIRKGVEAIKKALNALPAKMTITTPEEVRYTTIPAHRTKVPAKSALKASKMVDDCAAFEIDDLKFITQLNKTFPLMETINQERRMMGLAPMATPELPVDWEEGSRQRVCRFGSRDVRCFNYRGVPAYHEVVHHEITDEDKTFALRLNEKLDVRVAQIAKSEQARRDSEEQARKDRQASLTTRTLTEEEVAEALAMLRDVNRRCKVEKPQILRITLSVPKLTFTAPDNQDEEDARFAEQQARRVWTDYTRLVVPPPMWTADERGEEIEDEEETY